MSDNGPKVAIRLGTTGEADIKSTFADIEQSGKNAAGGIAGGFEAAGEKVSAVADATAKRWQKSQSSAAEDAAAALRRYFAASEKLGSTGLTSAIGGDGEAAGTAALVAEMARLQAARDEDIRSTKEAAAARRSAAAADREEQAAAAALRDILDPVSAAQARAIETYKQYLLLEERGILTAHELAQAERLLGQEVLEVQQRMQLQTATNGAARAGFQQLGYQVGDFFVMVDGGQGVLRAFSTQLPQAVQALQLMTAGAEEGGGKLATFATIMQGPVGIALVALIPLASILAKNMFDLGDDTDKASKSTIDFSNSLAASRGVVGDYKTAIDQLTDATKGLINTQALLIDNTRLFTQTAATQLDQQISDLKAKVDARPKASIWSTLFGTGKLDEAQTNGMRDQLQILYQQRDQIQQTVASAQAAYEARSAAESTDDKAAKKAVLEREKARLLERRQRTIADEGGVPLQDSASYYEPILSGDFARRMAEIQKEEDALNKGADKHAATLGRQAAAMEVNADAGLELARAYLESTDAGMKAEAVRKALTDATKKGIDAEEQVRRQLAINVADGAVAGAKAVAALRDETTGRKAVNEAIVDGKIDIGQMNDALKEESALRPLLALQTIAHGEALEQITKIINAYRAALKDANAEEAHSNALAALDGLSSRIQDAQLALKSVGDTSGALDIEQARRAAQRNAKAKGYNPDDTKEFVETSVQAALTEQVLSRATKANQMLRTERDTQEIARANLALIGADAIERDRILDRLKLQQQLTVELGDEYEKYAPAILAAHDATDLLNQSLQEQQQAWDEINRAGDQFVDTVFDPRNWHDFGDLGLSVLKMIEEELIKLAILNPLKNALFGESNTTLSDVGGLFSSLFHFAGGTDGAPGGYSLVGEEGPEIMNVPRGAQIIPAGETKRLLSGGGGGMSIAISIPIDATGADPASLGRVQAEVADLRRSLPGIIVETVAQAQDRRWLR